MIQDMSKDNLWKDLVFYILFGVAILLTAYKGTLDWMGIAIIAVILKLPGTIWLRKIFSKLSGK